MKSKAQSEKELETQHFSRENALSRKLAIFVCTVKLTHEDNKLTITEDNYQRKTSIIIDFTSGVANLLCYA
jgi:hypothetical protein